MNDLKANMTDRVQLVSSSSQASAQSSSTAVNAYAKEQSTVNQSGKTLPVGVNDEVAEVSEEQVKEAVSKLNDYVQSTERTLDFQMDEDSGRTVIKVFDKQSSELIRQIPNELALTLAQKLNDEEPSLLFSAQV